MNISITEILLFVLRNLSRGLSELVKCGLVCIHNLCVHVQLHTQNVKSTSFTAQSHVLNDLLASLQK